MAPAQQRKSLSQRLGVTPTDIDAVVPVARAHNLMAFLYETFPSAYWDSDELTTLALGICMLAKDAQTIDQMAELGEDRLVEIQLILDELLVHHQRIRELWGPLMELDDDDARPSRKDRLSALIQERLNGYDTPNAIIDEGMALIRRPERRSRLTLEV